MKPEAGLWAAFEAEEQPVSLRRIRIGTYLAMVLLPLGSLIDWLIYPDLLEEVGYVRLGFTLAMVPILGVVQTRVGRRFHRALGVLLAMLPAGCMAWIIAVTTRDSSPDASPYYAGFNLVLLAIGLVLQWNTVQSLLAVAGVMVMYLAVCWGHWSGLFLNNLYFIALTGVIVVVGNTIQSRLRFRDFELRHALARSREELERGNRQLRELDELKGRFFANISHELRTPLTLLLAPLEVLRRESGPATPPATRENLEIMHSNGLRLLKLINDLLDLVRLDAGGLALQPVPVDLEPVVGGLLQSVKRVAEEKGVRLARRLAPGLRPVLADPDRLEKILLNLLFNALKFTPAGGSVEVGAATEGDRILLWVADTGVGIDPEHLTRVFDRFWQADTSAQRRFQGAGIGLALVKELVEAHQGTVDIRSQPGVGTTMEVRLPAAKSDPRASASAMERVHPAPGAGPAGVTGPAGAVGAVGAATEAEVLTGPVAAAGGGSGLGPGWLTDLYRRAELFHGLTPLRDNLRGWRPAGPGGRPKVLIADDEPEMRRFLGNQLNEEYEVAEAVDGEQASALITQLLPDVVVCDMMMPGKDGLEVCREVRARLATQSIPFLMLTARVDEETKHGVLGAGASDFLAKPFSSSELRVRIRNLVSSHQLQKALAWQNRKLEATLEQLQETELQLVQSEKLASLGRMSAGLIHEINNPLNFAHTALHLLGRMSGKLPPEDLPVFEETVRDVQEGLARVSGIISDLRGFSHREGGPLQPVDMHALVELSRRFLAAELRSGVVLVNEVPAGFTVPGEKNRLCQVLVNLFQNALDALAGQPPPGGAEIRVTAEEEARGRRVVIRDNGPGIPREVQARIFDPFFTTKPVGQGMGLGLSICYRIMNDLGGRVTVRSEPGRFTEFVLEFPDEVRETPAIAASLGA